MSTTTVINIDSSQPTSGTIVLGSGSTQTQLNSYNSLSTPSPEMDPFGFGSSVTISSADYNNYSKVIEYIKNFILSNMLNILTTTLDNGSYCTPNTIEGATTTVNNQVLVSQTSTINILPGSVVEGCRFEQNISTKVDTGKLCYNINDRLNSISESERLRILDQVLFNLENSQTFIPIISNRTRFFNLLKQNLKNYLVTSSGKSVKNCSQRIIVKKDQTLNVSGKIKCYNSTFRLDNNLILKSFLACLVLPSFDNIEKDVLLRNYFVQGDNTNCVYYKKVIEGCNDVTKKRLVEVNIIQQQLGTGTCPYTNYQRIQEDCTIPTCKVGPWSEWSNCKLADPNVDTVGKQKRVRKYITNGEGCAFVSTLEERECTDFRPSYSDESVKGLQKDGTWARLLTRGEVKTQPQIITVLFIVFVLIIIFILFKF